MSVSTVRVKSSHPDHEHGFYVINESDFDPKTHELWVSETQSETERAAIKRDEAMKAAAAIKAAQVNSAKPALGLPGFEKSGNKPAQDGMSSGAGSDRTR